MAFFAFYLGTALIISVMYHIINLVPNAKLDVVYAFTVMAIIGLAIAILALNPDKES